MWVRFLLAAPNFLRGRGGPRFGLIRRWMGFDSLLRNQEVKGKKVIISFERQRTSQII